MNKERDELIKEKRKSANIFFYKYLYSNGGFYNKKELLELGFKENKINKLYKINFSKIMPDLNEDLYHKSQFEDKKIIKNFNYINNEIKKCGNFSNVVLIQFFVYLKSLKKKSFTKKDIDALIRDQFSFKMGR